MLIGKFRSGRGRWPVRGGQGAHPAPNAYLDADAIRRQANAVVRLTVVTVFACRNHHYGLPGNEPIAAADQPLTRALFLVVLGSALTMWRTMVKSKRVSDLWMRCQMNGFRSGPDKGVFDIWRSRT